MLCRAKCHTNNNPETHAFPDALKVDEPMEGALFLHTYVRSLLFFCMLRRPLLSIPLRRRVPRRDRAGPLFGIQLLDTSS